MADAEPGRPRRGRGAAASGGSSLPPRGRQSRSRGSDRGEGAAGPARSSSRGRSSPSPGPSGPTDDYAALSSAVDAVRSSRQAKYRGSKAHDIVYDIEAKRRREELAEQQPQVHILGEILGGTGFTGAVCCKWAVEAGTPQGENLWVLVEGDEAGQTQTDYPVQGTDVAVWSHPLDVHYNAGTLSGWPRMLLSVWHLDDDGRLELQGYGVLHVPCTPGSYEVSCPTWRPAGTPSQEMAAAFVGGVPHLKSTSVLYTDQQHRKNIATVSSGTVHVRFDVVMRNFHTYGVDLAQAATATTAAGV